MRGLYPIVDLDALAAAARPVISFAERVIAAKPPLVQLRAKHASARDTIALLRALAPICHDAGVLLFANDRADLALIAGCDGVHVGQDDLSIADVRRIAPGLKVGVSTHDLAQLDRALAEGPDYVAFGPVFSTGSKVGADPVVGLDGLARASAAARAQGCPLCAIGGIDVANVSEVARHAELAAVINALIPRPGESADVVTSRAVELGSAWSRDP